MKQLKMLEKKEWVQQPHKKRFILGIDFWFWLALIYLAVWLFYWLPLILRQNLPGGTKFSILLLSLGCWLTYFVGTAIVQFRKGGDV